MLYVSESKEFRLNKRQRMFRWAKKLSLMLSCTIDAEEQRHVATAVIPGSFMQANMIRNVHVNLEVKIELFAKIDPKAYDNFILMENGKKLCM